MFPSAFLQLFLLLDAYPREVTQREERIGNRDAVFLALLQDRLRLLRIKGDCRHHSMARWALPLRERMPALFR